MGDSSQFDEALGRGRFGELLRAHRLAACHSQEELAERAGLSRRAVSDLERGIRRAPYPATVRRLAQALSLTEHETAVMIRAAQSSTRLSAAASTSGTTGSAPSTNGASPPLHNLPIQLSTFVGRDRDLDGIGDALGATRLLTLTGTGGVGKTRLALRAAGNRLDCYPDGIWFIDVAPLRDPTLLPHSAAAALGQPEHQGRSVLEALLAHLADRRLLLVLDNCEHVLTACANLVTRILQVCPGVSVLATSREALHVSGERIWLVQPLSVPEDADAHDFEHVAGHEAIQLFAERAAASHRQFSLTSANLRAVAEICRGLDGIPLAIELAAARASVLTPEEIAAHLNDRLELFTMRSGAARQHTLRALCEWSHQLLSEVEAALFRRLSVFAGGWTLEAAEVVCASGEALSQSVLPLLADLCEKSIIQVHHRSHSTRYSFHETLRQFAADKLREASEESTYRDRHLAWCLRLAEQIDAELRGPRGRRGLDQLAIEHDNLRVALGWGRDRGTGLEDPLRLASTLGWYWWAREHSHEGCRWLEGLLELSDSIAQPEHSHALQTERARALAALGLLYVRRGDLAAARPVVERGLACGRALQSARLLAWPLLLLGQIELGEGNFEASEALLEEGLAICESAGSPRPYQFLSWLGQLAVARSRFDEAEVLYERQLRLAREHADRFFEAVALGNLGRMAVRQGDAKMARSRLEDSLALMAEVATGDVPYLLSQFVDVAILEESWIRALRLAGAVTALLASRGATLQPGRSNPLTARVDAARRGLPDSIADAALAEGETMSLEAAVAYALGD